MFYFIILAFYALIFLLGAVLGSGLNCLAYRMARQQKWSEGHSVCPACGHQLSALDLIPVLSWLCLRGKCRYCGGKISPRYVLSEAFLGVCFLSVLWRFPFQMEAVLWLLLCCCLFTLSLVDLEIQIIPDRFLLIPAIARIAWLIHEGELLSGLIPALVLGGGVLALSLIMDKVLKRDSMGGGDIKLLALLGLYFPLWECMLLLIIACILGIVIAMLLADREDAAFPFGPALSLAAWVTMLFGESIVSWYLALF